MFILHMQTCQFCSILAKMAEIFCLREREKSTDMIIGLKDHHENFLSITIGWWFVVSQLTWFWGSKPPLEFVESRMFQ